MRSISSCQHTRDNIIFSHAGSQGQGLDLRVGVGKRRPAYRLVQLRRLHEQYIYTVDIERDPGRLQAVVPRGMQLHPGIHLFIGHARQRQERRHRGHGRQVASRSHLHGGAHRDIGLGAISRRHRRPRSRGEPDSNVARHAVPGGAHLAVRAAEQRARLDPERRQEEGLAQVRLWSDGRGRHGQPG